TAPSPQLRQEKLYRLQWEHSLLHGAVDGAFAVAQAREQPSAKPNRIKPFSPTGSRYNRFVCRAWQPPADRGLAVVILPLPCPPLPLCWWVGSCFLRTSSRRRPYHVPGSTTRRLEFISRNDKLGAVHGRAVYRHLPPERAIFYGVTERRLR
ncbi:unnamed protein product, partial [Ectocarpus sp. 12 AP-2014]